MGIKTLLIIIVDISGYTNFIRMHKISLLHAEKIVGELMETMIDEVEAPVVVHEILGDAISLYALDDGSPGLADRILLQVDKYFQVFRKREAYLMRECGFCVCEACNKVKELKLKAILHAGEAAFTKVHDIQKISGEDIITAHRLLKNTIPSHEYIFVTNSYLERCQFFDSTGFENHTEQFDDIGAVHGKVKIFEPVKATSEEVSGWMKFKFLMKIEGYMFARLFGKSKPEFKNLPTEAKSTTAT